MSPRFRNALHEIRTAPASADGDTKRAFHTCANASLVHGSTTLHHISTDLHRDLHLI
jgi:hypothetical protein